MNSQVVEAAGQEGTEDLRERVHAVEDGVFELAQVPLKSDREVLASALLVANATILLNGDPGSGKTTLARIIGHAYFSRNGERPDMAVVNCHQDLTAHDVLYDLDLAELQAGRELVHPKPIITSRFKFLNEIQRAPGVLHNALLPLLAEHEVRYRGATFATPEFLCMLDRNPTDSASRDLAPAFLDRIDCGFLMPVPHLREAMVINAHRRGHGQVDWDGLERWITVRLGIDDLERAWRAVTAVAIPVHAELWALMLIEAFRLCVKEERSTLNPSFELDCSVCTFRGEICSHLRAVPGHRPLDSLLRLAQAKAWRQGRQAVAVADLDQLLPYVLGHRLRLRPELLRTVPSVLAWIEDVAVGEILQSKEKTWRQAASAVLQGRKGALNEIQDHDLVVRELAVYFDDPVFEDLRLRYRRQREKGALRGGLTWE